MIPSRLSLPMGSAPPPLLLGAEVAPKVTVTPAAEAVEQAQAAALEARTAERKAKAIAATAAKIAFDTREQCQIMSDSAVVWARTWQYFETRLEDLRGPNA